MKLTVSPEVAEPLGHYVYLYIDPRSNKPFYVGKRRGKRATAHLPGPKDEPDNLIGPQGESRRDQVLTELDVEGLAPQLDILAHGLADAETALRIEAAVIDLLGL